MATIQTYRLEEIQNIINSVFKQFKITDPAEITDISKDILNRLNTGAPISSVYSTSNKASSAKYRADVRAVLVDVISELLYLRDIDMKLNNVEANSRDIIQNTSNRVDRLLQELRAADDTIIETFEEGLVNGELVNLVAKDGNLRIDKSSFLSNIKSISYEVIPAPSVVNNIRLASSGSLDSLIKTGVGSDSFWLRIETPVVSNINYLDDEGDQVGPVDGIFIELQVTTDNIVPSSFSVKASTELSIYSISSYQNGNWIKINNSQGSYVQDKTADTYTFVDDIDPTEQAATSYKILLHVPFETERTENNTIYNIGLYNIKVTPAQDTENIIGEYKSNKYKITKGSLFKAKLETEQNTNYGSFIEYTAVFNIRDKNISIPILPKNESTVHTGQTIIPGDNTLTLPFPITDTESLEIWTEATIDPDTVSVDANGYQVSIGNLENNSAFVLLTYTCSSPTSWERIETDGELVGIQRTLISGNNFMQTDEAILPDKFYITDVHRKDDGRLFSLNYTPFINVNESPETTFNIHVNGILLDITDITPYNNPGSVVEFSEDTKEFYLKDNKLYTNFNLLLANEYGGQFDTINDIKVTYPTKADSVHLEAKLYGQNPLIDLYKLKLIGVDNGL